MDSIQQVKWDIWRRAHYFKEGQEAHDAFELAITEGLLSRLASAPNYSGDYMLMQTRIIDNVDFFKRKDTREYIRNEHDHDVNQEIFRESQRRKMEQIKGRFTNA